MPETPDFTTLLLSWSNGDEAARSKLVDVAYDELRQLAHRHLRRVYFLDRRPAEAPEEIGIVLGWRELLK